MIVRELITKLGFSLDNSGANAAEKRTRQLKTQANQASLAFRNMFAAYASFASVKAVFKIADEMQSLRARIEQLPQTLGDVGEAFDEVARRANKNRAPLDAYTKLYVRLGQAGKNYIKDQKDLLGITDTISQALVVGGASTAEAASVMLQFSQAIGSGILQGDEFRAMAEAAPQYMDQLAIALDIPREKLKKMGTDGKLTSKQVIEATRLMANHFEERFKKMPITVGQAWIIITNKFSAGLDRLNRKSLFITKIANAMLKAFDAIGTGVDWLVDKFGGIENMLRLVGIALAIVFGPKVLAMMGVFRVVTIAALWPFIKMAALVTAVTMLLEDLYVWINGGDSLIGKLIGPWEQWAPYVMGAVEMVKDAFVWFGEFLGAFAAMMAGVFTLNPYLFIEGLKGLTAMLSTKLLEWGVLVYKAFFEPIVKAIMDAWNSVSGFFAGVWDRNKKRVASSGVLAGAGQKPGGLNAVTPSQMSGAGMGAGKPSINNSTNVTVTVPPGTTAEQVGVINKAAKESFSKQGDAKMSRQMAVYSL